MFSVSAIGFGGNQRWNYSQREDGERKLENLMIILVFYGKFLMSVQHRVRVEGGNWNERRWEGMKGRREYEFTEELR